MTSQKLENFLKIFCSCCLIWVVVWGRGRQSCCYVDQFFVFSFNNAVIFFNLQQLQDDISKHRDNHKALNDNGEKLVRCTDVDHPFIRDQVKEINTRWDRLNAGTSVLVFPFQWKDVFWNTPITKENKLFAQSMPYIAKVQLLTTSSQEYHGAALGRLFLCSRYLMMFVLISNHGNPKVQKCARKCHLKCSDYSKHVCCSSHSFVFLVWYLYSLISDPNLILTF